MIIERNDKDGEKNNKELTEKYRNNNSRQTKFFLLFKWHHLLNKYYKNILSYTDKPVSTDHNDDNYFNDGDYNTRIIQNYNLTHSSTNDCLHKT
jgi:hypothetical protein